MKELLLSCAYLLFPRLCAACGKALLEGEETICRKCLDSIPQTDFHNRPDNEMEQRLWGKVPLAGATAYFHYMKGTDSQRLLHDLKYKGRQSIGRVLGRSFGTILQGVPRFRSVDCIVPVPLHSAKLKQRGYNQSECIAEGLAQVLQKPIDTQNLYRQIENPTQTRKSVFERWGNSNNIFNLKDEQVFAGKHVLLVDDVMTTGSTIEACALTLLRSPHVRISVATLAIA